MLDPMVRACLVLQETTKWSSNNILHSRYQSMRVLVALQPLHIISVLDLGHSNKCAVVSHCFNLLFPNKIWCETSLVFIWHRHILFDEVSIQVFGPFLNQIVFLLRFMSSLYILDNNPLSRFIFGKFSKSVAYLVILLTFSFAEWKF